MKTIEIHLTDEEYGILRDYARDMAADDLKVAPRKIIEQFVSDLTYSERRGGSDESDLASDWFDRSRYNF